MPRTEYEGTEGMVLQPSSYYIDRDCIFKSSSLSVSGFMADELAATLPLGTLSWQDALCTQPVVLAQPATQVTCNMQEELIDERNRGTHPDLEQRPRQGAARLDRNRALSEHRLVARVREPSRTDP